MEHVKQEPAHPPRSLRTFSADDDDFINLDDDDEPVEDSRQASASQAFLLNRKRRILVAPIDGLITNMTMVSAIDEFVDNLIDFYRKTRTDGIKPVYTAGSHQHIWSFQDGDIPIATITARYDSMDVSSIRRIEFWCKDVELTPKIWKLFYTTKPGSAGVGMKKAAAYLHANGVELTVRTERPDYKVHYKVQSSTMKDRQYLSVVYGNPSHHLFHVPEANSADGTTFRLQFTRRFSFSFPERYLFFDQVDSVYTELLLGTLSLSCHDVVCRLSVLTHPPPHHTKQFTANMLESTTKTASTRALFRASHFSGSTCATRAPSPMKRSWSEYRLCWRRRYWIRYLFKSC